MARRKTEYTEIDNIKEDLNSLKDNVVELTRHVQKNGNAQALALSDTAKSSLRQLNASSKTQMKRMERRVKAKPVQSVAIAFVAGVVASALFGRRG